MRQTSQDIFTNTHGIGDVFACVGTLTEAELLALVEDADEWYETHRAELQKNYEALVFRPEFFLNRAQGKRLDSVHEEATHALLDKATTISSVAQHYLEIKFGRSIDTAEPPPRKRKPRATPPDGSGTGFETPGGAELNHRPVNAK